MNEQPTATPAEIPAVQTPEVTTKGKYTRHGITIERRSAKSGAKYTARIKFQNKIHHLTLCDTVDESFKAAILARREIQAGRWDAFRKTTGLRNVETFAALNDIENAYLGKANEFGGRIGGFPGGDKGIKTKTKEHNFQALKRFLKSAGIDAGNPCSSVLTQKLVADWKWSRREASALEADTDAQIRVLRSAQSELLQARSVFSPEALSFYRDRADINLPKSIEKFCSEPGFTKLEKQEYHAPSDDTVAKTFDALGKLDTTTQDNRNVFVASWLAIGFGLRAGEIMRAQVKDFQAVDGDIFFRPTWRPKNKKICEIGVQLDAWQRLEPFLPKDKPDDYAIAGNVTERSTDVFRRISTLFKAIGWKTTHHIHELRAWSGCQIAMNHPQGLLAAQAFMRHSTYATTQKYYGHHIKVRLDKVALKIPAMPAPFVPVVVQQATA